MNLPRIIILGIIAVVLIVLVASLLVSRYVLRRGPGNPEPTPREVVENVDTTPTPTPLPQDIRGVTTEPTQTSTPQNIQIQGVPVTLTQTEVQRVINSTVFWVGSPDSDQKDILVVYPMGVTLQKDQQVTINGVINSISQVDRSGWNLTSDEEASLRDSGTYLRATSVETL